MKPGKKPKKGSGEGSGRLVRRLVAVVLTLAAIGGLVWAVARIGDAARSGIGPRDRYSARFADIDCAVPPGLDRAAFLSEVRYVSTLPESFQTLDPDLTAKLTAAFAAHPWVAAVEGVTVDNNGAVRVSLKFRVPVLAVKTQGGDVRVVDAACMLLPFETKSDGLPELVTPVAPPATPAGQPWTDGIVKRAVELVAAHNPRKLECTAKGWRLTTADGKSLVVEK